jgi:hypothetical protein
MQEENNAVAVTELNRWILRKVESEGYESLSMEEKVVIHVNALDWEMANRGVNRLIFGSDINFAVEMAECLRRVGAEKTAILFDELLSMIPRQPLPEDKDEREAYFRSLSDDDIGKLDLGIRELFATKDDLFTNLCGYFGSIRDRLAEQQS